MNDFEPLRLAESVTQEQIMLGWQDAGSADKPTVSIICHTYNHEAYIIDAIEGFLAQRTTFPFEILMHDDASTDGTSEIIKSYANRFPKIIRTMLQQKNQFSQGRRPARFTFPEARGEYIALCEGDDYWIDPYKLEKQVALLEQNDGVNLCIHPANRIDLPEGKHSVLGDHGNKVSIRDVSEPVGGPKHYAPTASYVLRTKEAMAMPRWFFDNPLPFGDYFIEALMGRKGILYTPHIMSVYRAGVPGSHFNRVQNRSVSKMLNDFTDNINGVRKLYDFEDIPIKSIDKKIWRIRHEYALKFFRLGAYSAYREAVPCIQGNEGLITYMALRLSFHSHSAFQITRAAARVRRKLRGACHMSRIVEDVYRKD